MSINRKYAAIFIAAAVLLTAAVMFFFAAGGGRLFGSEPKRHKPQPVLQKKSLSERQRLTAEHCRDSLGDDAALEAYDSIADKINSDSGEELWFDLSVDNDAFCRALFAYLSDHPEVFWIDPGNGYSYTEYSDSICFELDFSETGDALQSKKDLLDEKVSNIISNAPDNASDYDVELYLNDCLTELCEYDTEGGDKHNAYGALVQGRAVCDGYSHAFQLLCMELGIDCTVVEGTSEFNDSDDDGHMWNCVCLNDSWYHVDVTWNDSTDAKCEVEHYFYLNLTENQISRDHSISGGYSERKNSEDYFNAFVPECTSEELNYFHLNCVTIDDPGDDDEITAAMLEAARAKQGWCAYVISGSNFDSKRDDIIQNRASGWIDSVNYYTGGDPKIKSDGSALSYSDKQVLVILLDYE